jgi:amino acid transporter
MIRLRISIFPDIVNALVLTSALSAGNSYCYCASRCLYGLALEGKAPAFFRKCTKNGVPVYCVLATLMIALLAFLQVSNNAAVVLQWFINLVSSIDPEHTFLMLTRSGHCIAIDQFLRHVLHIPQVQESS